MDKKEDKFFVDTKFRHNKLSVKNTSIRAEVHIPGSQVRVYDNIHYPNAHANKIFKSSPATTHIVYKNTQDGSEHTITNLNK